MNIGTPTTYMCDLPECSQTGAGFTRMPPAGWVIWAWSPGILRPPGLQPPKPKTYCCEAHMMQATAAAKPTTQGNPPSMADVLYDIIVAEVADGDEDNLPHVSLTKLGWRDFAEQLARRLHVLAGGVEP